MKIYAGKTKIERLTENFLSIGKPEKQRNKENLDFVFTTPSGQDQINLEHTVRTLKKSLVMIGNSISKGGAVLIYTPLKQPRHVLIEKFFIETWQTGLISNFRYVNKKKQKMPNAVVILSNNVIEQHRIHNELNKLKLGSTFVNNTHEVRKGLFSIPGNNDSKRSLTLLTNLFKRAITIGLAKEIARLNKKFFPRLDSNQRPRT
jgi:ribosomal protein S2